LEEELDRLKGAAFPVLLQLCRGVIPGEPVAGPQYLDMFCSVYSHAVARMNVPIPLLNHIRGNAPNFVTCSLRHRSTSRCSARLKMRQIYFRPGLRPRPRLRRGITPFHRPPHSTPAASCSRSSTFTPHPFIFTMDRRRMYSGIGLWLTTHSVASETSDME